MALPARADQPTHSLCRGLGRERPAFFGDTSLWRCINEMAFCRVPLVQVEGGDPCLFGMAPGLARASRHHPEGRAARGAPTQWPQRHRSLVGGASARGPRQSCVEPRGGVSSRPSHSRGCHCCVGEPRRRLGRTDIRVSPVAMGCWAIVGDATWGQQDERDAIAAIHAALDAGVNFFDTAEGYGAGYSERILAKALKGQRDRAIIGSKVSPGHAGTYADLVRSCDASLANLGTDNIDVYHLHWPNREVPVQEILAGLARLQQAGKIRAVAVSNFGRQDLTELLAVGRCEVNQLPYSLLWRAIEHEIAPICVANTVSITCYSPIAQGLLSRQVQVGRQVPESCLQFRHFAATRPQARPTNRGPKPSRSRRWARSDGSRRRPGCRWSRWRWPGS